MTERPIEGLLGDVVIAGLCESIERHRGRLVLNLSILTHPIESPDLPISQSQNSRSIGQSVIRPWSGH
jgi:hypothetical protein